MVAKKYKSSTGVQLVFPVEVDNNQVYLEFTGPRSECIIKDDKIQKALEGSKRFKSGAVVLVKKIGEANAKKSDEKANDDEGKGNNAAVVSVPEITTMQDAKDYLRAEPYNIPHQSLNTPDNIVKKAAEAGVVFPNLEI